MSSDRGDGGGGGVRGTEKQRGKNNAGYGDALGRAKRGGDTTGPHPAANSALDVAIRQAPSAPDTRQPGILGRIADISVPGLDYSANPDAGALAGLGFDPVQGLVGLGGMATGVPFAGVAAEAAYNGLFGDTGVMGANMAGMQGQSAGNPVPSGGSIMGNADHGGMGSTAGLLPPAPVVHPQPVNAPSGQPDWQPKQPQYDYRQNYWMGNTFYPAPITRKV